MRKRYIYITLLSLLAFTPEATAQDFAQAPRLVISITIDQLRTDYLETYAPLFSQGGFKQLLDKGLVYSNASYNFTPVDHASAAASLITGSSPYYNGVTGAEWLNRKTLRLQNIVNDKEKGYSPDELLTSTLGDEMKIAFKGLCTVYSFATNAESAILSAGHVADGTVWFHQQSWKTASYYEPQSQWLSQYLRQNKPTQDANKSVTSLALRCIEQSGAGKDDYADLICLNYSLQQSDAVGYQLLDHTISDLLRGVQRILPEGRVLFILTGSGYTEQEQKTDNDRYNVPSGQFYINRASSLLNMYLGAVYGTAQYVESSYKNQLFLNRKLIEKKNLKLGDVLRQAQEFVLQMSGIRNVYTSTQLLTSDSQLLQRIRNGFNIDKCGDLIIEIAPGWQLFNEETQTSSVSRTSYIPFPIIFFGNNISAQRITLPVTVDRIAPTIARAIRIRAPNACSAEPLF